MMRWALIGFAPAFSAQALAAECHVPAAHQSLQDAVDLCAPGSTIAVDASYSLLWDAGVVYIERDVVIEGRNGMPDVPNLVVDRADVTVRNVRTATILDVYGDLPDAGVVVLYGALTLEDSKLASAEKAGLYAVGSDVVLKGVAARELYLPAVTVVRGEGGEAASLTIEEGDFQGNLAGAVIAAGADTTIRDTVFVGNVARYGADVLVDGLGDSRLDISGSRFDSSWSWGVDTYDLGGAVVAYDADTTAADSDFVGTYAARTGGAIALLSSSSSDAAQGRPTFHGTDLRFDGSSAELGGGALLAVGYDVRIDGASHFRSSHGGDLGVGGAVALYDSSATFEGTELRYNVAGAGGAVYASASAVRFEAAQLDNEGASTTYGGLVFAEGSEVTARGTRFASSGATSFGGALYAKSSTIAIEAGEISGTFATDGLGGFAYVEGGSFALSGGTVADGTRSWAGGLLYAVGAEVSVREATIEGSIASYGGALYVVDPRAVSITDSRFCASAAYEGGVVELAGKPLAADVELRVERDVFYGNSGAAALLLAWATEPGFGAVKFYNDDFVDNLTAADVRVQLPGADLRNLLFVGSKQAIDAQLPATGGYNLYDGVQERVSGLGGYEDVGAIEGDPRFVGGAPTGCAADLRLAADSPARDAGDPGMVGPEDDRIDIGAFEHFPEPDPDPEVDTDDAAGAPTWVTGGGGCATGGLGGGALLTGLAAALGLARRRPPAARFR